MNSYKSKSGLTYKQIGKYGNDLVFATGNAEDQVVIYSSSEVQELIDTRFLIPVMEVTQ